MTGITWEMVVDGTHEQLKVDLGNKKEKYEALVRKKNNLIQNVSYSHINIKTHEQEILELLKRLNHHKERSVLSKKKKKQKKVDSENKSFKIQEALDMEERKLAEIKSVLEKCQKKLNKIEKKLDKMKSRSLEELKVSKANKKLQKKLKAIEGSSQHPSSSLGTPKDSTSSNGKAESVCPAEDPFRSLVQVLSSYISSKESSLECPVCYSVPALPIYRCPNNHIICKICLPRLSKKCPTCRTRSGRLGPKQIHRQAESSWKELDMLKTSMKNLGL